MKLKSPDIEKLLQCLVADGAVARAALMVLTTSSDRDRFAELFKIEVDALLEKANHDNPGERRLHELMKAARDRLLGHSSVPSSAH